MSYVYYVVAITASLSLLSMDISSTKELSSIEDIRKIEEALCAKFSASKVTVLNYILLRTEKDN